MSIFIYKSGYFKKIGIYCPVLPVRLMVGLRFLVPTIGVRVPDWQQCITPISYNVQMRHFIVDQLITWRKDYMNIITQKMVLITQKSDVL